MKEVLAFIHDNPWMMKVVWSLLGLVITIVLRNVINRLLHRHLTDASKIYTIRKVSYYVITVVYVIILSLIWLEVAGNLATFVGLLTAGLAVALRDVFANLAGWVFIVLRKPFSVGDRILIHQQRGDVIDVRLFQFSIIEISSPEHGEQSTGRIIDIPNHYVFVHPIVNYVKGFAYIWNEVNVTLTFDSNWKKAKQLFVEVADRHALHLSDKAEEAVQQANRQYMIYFNKLTPIVYTDVHPTGITLTLRYICVPKNKRNTTNDIWEEILEIAATHDDIELIKTAPA